MIRLITLSLVIFVLSRIGRLGLWAVRLPLSGGRIPWWVSWPLGLILSGILGWFAFRTQDWMEVMGIFREFPAQNALLGLLFFGVNLLFRAFRWRILFITERISLFKLLLTQNAGTGINNLLPLRVLSEPIQLAIVTKRFGITAPTALATLATEHVLDIFATALLLATGVAFLPELRNLSIHLAGAFVMATVSLAVLILVAKGNIPGLPFIGRIGAVGRWTAAISTLQQARTRLAISFLSTVLHWFALGMSGWFVADGLGISVNPLTMVVLFLAMHFFIAAVPSAPGAAGTFEFAIIYSLGFFGITPEAATPFALVMHAIIFLPPIMIALLMVSVSRGSLRPRSTSGFPELPPVSQRDRTSQ